MPLHYQFISISLLLSITLCGCSLYQSSGREAIEKDSANIVTSAGFSADLKSYFNCLYADKMPDFLKQDLLILNTKNEPEYATVLASEKNNPSWIYVYIYDDISQLHYSCQIHKIDHFDVHTEDLVNVGVLEINNLNKRYIKNK